MEEWFEIRSMHEHHFEVKKTARYYSNAPISGSYQTLWFCLHGQGQLAKFFIRKFANLDQSKHLVICPEGLSRYYLNDNYGRVGANWMTKEDRLTDIKDYVNYLTALKTEIEGKVEIKSKRVVLGFSQGSATVCRWLNERDLDFNHLILWSGVFPPDLKLDGNVFPKLLQSTVVVGSNDEYISDDKLIENLSMIEQIGIQAKVFRFEGGHTIPAEVLNRVSLEI